MMRKNCLSFLRGEGKVSFAREGRSSGRLSYAKRRFIKKGKSFTGWGGKGSLSKKRAIKSEGGALK